MAALQRICGARVLLDREKRRFPSLHCMAGRAFARIRALGKLSVMCVLVTIGALGKGDGLLEVPSGMALGAIDRNMLPFERELRLRVIEMRSHRLQRDLFPTACAVAGGTALRETAVMRIFVAIGTLVERNSRILRLAIGAIGMTLRALHLSVHSC